MSFYLNQVSTCKPTLTHASLPLYPRRQEIGQSTYLQSSALQRLSLCLLSVWLRHRFLNDSSFNATYKNESYIRCSNLYYNLSTKEVEAERLRVQGHPWLHIKFDDSLGYLRPVSGGGVLNCLGNRGSSWSYFCYKLNIYTFKIQICHWALTHQNMSECLTWS